MSSTIVVNDFVVLTDEGIRARRNKNRLRNALIGGTVGWFALPAIIPGEAIGVAGAATFGVSEGMQAAIGSAIGGITGANFLNELKKGLIGQVVSIDYSTQPDPEADVLWKLNQKDGSAKVFTKRHKLKHLQKILIVDENKIRGQENA